MLQEDEGKKGVQSNLPHGFVLCNPEIGFAHGSIKMPINYTNVLHYTEVNGVIETVYLLCANNLFNINLPLELHFISIKHHKEEDWYFAEGILLSSDGTCAIKFLLEKAVYDRNPQAMDEMNRTVQKVIPEMLRTRGLPSIQALLHLKKYTW